MKYLSLLLIVFAIACEKGKVMHTDSGMKYILHRHDKNTTDKPPQVGDYVTVAMVYKNDKDSVLYDSRLEGRPLRFKLIKPSFAGSFEDGLTYLVPGDSATFFISSDSLFDKVINMDTTAVSLGQARLDNPSPGKYFRFEVSLIKVQPAIEAEVEMAMEESRLERAEQNALEKFMEEKKITAELLPEGFYLTIDSAGNGPTITEGSKVSLNFTGRFLNGFTFESNEKWGRPLIFTVGQQEVIEGWELAFLKLREGDKATIILPSRLAYGKDGIKQPNTQQYKVPPYATLIFDVEILKVEKSVTSAQER
jgi:FKBP-type peptidyl-prolyl cis-trans isomerase